MRFVFACLGFLLLLPVAAFAADPDRPSTQAATAVDKLDRLFTDLKRERNEIAARRLAESIRRQWGDSGSATVDLLMMHAARAMKDEQPAIALDLLDQVTVLEPGYAEGWNRRASVHFMMKDYAKSMADIARTLALEPRHFGALTGLANILRAAGKEELALKAFQQALSVYPMMRDAQKAVGEIADKITGQSI